MCEMPQSLSLTWRLPPTCSLTWIVLLNPSLTHRRQPAHSWTWSHWPVQWVHWLISCLRSHTDKLGGCSCCWLANTDTLLTPFLCLNYPNGLIWNTDTLRQWYCHDRLHQIIRTTWNLWYPSSHKIINLWYHRFWKQNHDIIRPLISNNDYWHQLWYHVSWFKT